MRVVTVPCLQDNFAYLVIDGGRAAVVDPGEAAPVLAAAEREGVTVEAVWATHHHSDHVGGVEALARPLPGLIVIGHAHDRARIAGLTRAVDDGDAVELGRVRARVIHNPGHTLGAISYYVEAPDGGGEPGAVFTGDTLFAAGCGRLFEGTAAMMHASLARLAALPDATRVYFGHEYSDANLRFAAVAEPGNDAVPARAKAVAAVRARGEWTTPSTIGEERATNPFIRAPDVDTFAARRSRKDTFRG